MRVRRKVCELRDRDTNDRTIFPTGSAAARARAPASALGSARLALRPTRAAAAARAASAPDGRRLAAAAVARVRRPAPRGRVLARALARCPPRVPEAGQARGPPAWRA